MSWAAVVIVIAGMHFAQPVLVPIALAILVSFLLAPVASRLEGIGLGRTASVLVAVLGATALTLSLGWFVVAQLHEVADRLPEYKGSLLAKIEDFREWSGGSVERAAKVVEEIGGDLGAVAPEPTPQAVPVEVVERAPVATAWMRSALSEAARFLVVSGLVALFVTFMLLQRDALRDRIHWLLGKQRLNVTTQMLEEASSKVARYLFAQVVVNGTTGLCVGLGLWAIGVPDSLLWGLLAGLLRFLPYVGPWIAALCPILVSFAVSDGWRMPLETIGLFLVIEILSNNVFEPWVYGARTGLSSLAIVVAAVFWTFLWGVVGLVLSTPLTVCLVVMGKYIPQLRGLTVVLGDQAVLSAAARLYQRLLAGDLAGAWALLAPELESKPLLEVCDESLLPALVLAAEDSRRGTLQEERRESIESGLEELLVRAAETDAASRPPLARVTGERTPRILCLPASDAFDEIASRMLCEILRRDRIDCEVASVVLFASEMVDLVDRHGADVVCVSHAQPPALSPTRYLCKRLVENHAGTPLLVGAWSSAAGERPPQLRLPRGGDFHVARTLAEARAHARRLLEPLRLEARSELAAREP